MAFDFRLNILQVFRRLGIQTGARLPQLNDNVQMTMILSDLSKLVPAPIEPRALAGVNIPGSLGNISTVQIQSLAAGGIFLETFVFRAVGFAAEENYIFDVTLTDLAMPALAQLNIGGTPILSRFTGAEIPSPPAGVSVPGAAAGAGIDFAPGIFVPNQAFFTLATRTANERLDIAIFYRELPAVEEVG